MQEYEIRVLGRTGRPTMIMVQQHYSDDAIIQIAKRVAKTAQFEVWHGTERVFCSHPTRPQAA